METIGADQQAVRPRPSLVEMNGRQVSQIGFSTYLLEDHLRHHAVQKVREKDAAGQRDVVRIGTWCSISCLARTMYLRDTPTNRKKARKALPRAFRTLLLRGIFVVFDYEPRIKGHGGSGEIKQVKLFDGHGDTVEDQCVRFQLTKRRKPLRLSQQLMRRAELLTGIDVEDEP
jgi:hypothetical protein